MFFYSAGICEICGENDLKIFGTVNLKATDAQMFYY
jgi:hypothetical protein